MCIVRHMWLFVAAAYSADVSLSGVSTIMSAKVSWLDARSQCTRTGGHLVTDIADVSCKVFSNPISKKVWINGHRVSSWVQSKGCFRINGSDELRSESIEGCLSICKTANVGFTHSTGRCNCLKRMPSINVTVSQCKNDIQPPVNSADQYSFVYSITDIDVGIDEHKWSNTTCLGLYVNCSLLTANLIPDNCNSFHRVLCGNELLPDNGTQPEPETKCFESNTDFNTMCKRLPEGSNVWTNVRRFWHIPFGTRHLNNSAIVRNCSYAYCNNDISKKEALSKNCNAKLDGYACICSRINFNKPESSLSTNLSSCDLGAMPTTPLSSLLPGTVLSTSTIERYTIGPFFSSTPIHPFNIILTTAIRRLDTFLSTEALVTSYQLKRSISILTSSHILATKTAPISTTIRHLDISISSENERSHVFSFLSSLIKFSPTFVTSSLPVTQDHQINATTTQSAPDETRETIITKPSNMILLNITNNATQTHNETTTMLAYSSNYLGIIVGVPTALACLFVTVSGIIFCKKRRTNDNDRNIEMGQKSSCEEMDLRLMSHPTNPIDTAGNDEEPVIMNCIGQMESGHVLEHGEVSGQEYAIVKTKSKVYNEHNKIKVLCDTEDEVYNRLDRELKVKVESNDLNVYDTMMGLRANDDPTYTITMHAGFTKENKDDVYNVVN